MREPVSIEGTPSDGVTLTVPGDPVAKARPRVYNGTAVTPLKTRNWEAYIRFLFTHNHPHHIPYTGPVSMDVEFWKPNRGKPDVDNLYKLVADALNGLAYKDDSQVKRLLCNVYEPDMKVQGARGLRNRKAGDPLTYKGEDYEPHTSIRITPMEEQ